MRCAPAIALLCLTSVSAAASPPENYENVVGPGSLTRDELAMYAHTLMGKSRRGSTNLPIRFLATPHADDATLTTIGSESAMWSAPKLVSAAVLNSLR